MFAIRSTIDYRKKVAAIYLLVFFVDLINMFTTSVACPDIGHAWQALVAQLAWINTVCILGLSIVIPASACLAAHYGSKTVFVASLLTFLCTRLSPSIEALIAWCRGFEDARQIQAICARAAVLNHLGGGSAALFVGREPGRSRSDGGVGRPGEWQQRQGGARFLLHAGPQFPEWRWPSMNIDGR
ncbi:MULTISPECIES: hypothetical protein [unclassified Janthinobacterium]|uniref:hypothetical protein n=1 Tax=unclassified Janthinobacterium TaxID=2610881 RepID=UPI0018CBDBE5|nr:hypothetical protein [Janthinobacterium sp. CG_23.4]MDH6160254.1 MFS family permease [Janthinobacterium sp. CG_23.4]